MSKYLLIIALSFLPLIEARFGFPIGYKLLEVNLTTSFILAYIGNVISILILNVFFYNVIERATHNRFALIIKKFIHWVTEKVKTRHQKRMENLATLTLLAFVAVPLPVSGVYSGTILGYLAGLNQKQTLATTIIGSFISLLIVLATIESIDISSKFFVKLLG